MLKLLQLSRWRQQSPQPSAEPFRAWGPVWLGTQPAPPRGASAREFAIKLPSSSRFGNLCGRQLNRHTVHSIYPNAVRRTGPPSPRAYRNQGLAQEFWNTVGFCRNVREEIEERRRFEEERNSCESPRHRKAGHRRPCGIRGAPRTRLHHAERESPPTDLERKSPCLPQRKERTSAACGPGLVLSVPDLALL